MTQSQTTIDARSQTRSGAAGPPGAPAPLPTEATPVAVLTPADTFVHRHLGPDDVEIGAMLATLGLDSLDALTEAVVPADIRLNRPLDLEAPATDGRGEHELLSELRAIASSNEVRRSFIGMGYSGCIVPPVIQRNVLESPGWYTQYTPYQSEISQGRLEALLTFQTMVCDLTGLPVAGASLLDEATAAAEAMSMCHRIAEGRSSFHVASDCHPQTIEVVRLRGESQGVRIVTGPIEEIDFAAGDLCGVLVQYPTTDGRLVDYRDLVQRAHDGGALVVVAADLLALTLVTPPGEFGADIAVGSTQRFGVPLGAGGPHAAYMATNEAHVRKMPGRLIGVSRDAAGNRALRMAIQTREQHIKRDRATSNICTAQVLLAIMAAMYAVYHGPEGLRRIARRVHQATRILREGLSRLGHEVPDSREVFDTLRVTLRDGMTATQVLESAGDRGINLREFGDGTIGVSLDETVTTADLGDVLACFGGGAEKDNSINAPADGADEGFDDPFRRQSEFLTHPVFNTHHSETEMLRYLKRLESRDLSLAQSMIPLGSCTMKLNATSEMRPVTWPEFSEIHPFAPAEQTRGYAVLYRQLESWLAEITGFDAVSLQPNAGSQGEYAGLLAIGAWHRDRGQGHRHVCLIPTSAHGTNPASAVIAGMRVVPIACDDRGNIDVADLLEKATQHAEDLSALMITYPSTHGVFEASIQTICDIVHEHGGQVYLDGANMNAQVGLCRPGDFGADVCHLNLHKTFCIPHGGGGPGMGPIAVAPHLAPFLPGHPIVRPDSAGDRAIGPIAAAPYGSPSILPISWMYIALMGPAGLRKASQVAILNANYMARRLADHYEILYRGESGLVAHEFIIDCRTFEKSADIRIDDIAKRLMDYGFHAPTMAWPVPGTLMIEPTESESLDELDRFCDALIAIRGEIAEIEGGRADRTDNVLKNAPHTMAAVSADEWSHPYAREQAAYPASWLREYKFWPPVGRVDNPYGDRNLMCTCGE